MLKMQQICIKLKVTVAISKTDILRFTFKKSNNNKMKLFTEIGNLS